MINVTVWSVAGETLDLEVRSDATVSVVKDHIGAHWSLPAKYQQLVHDKSVLEDADGVASRCAPDGSPLQLTMVMSMGIVTKELNDLAGFGKQLSLLRTLPPAGQPGSGVSLDIMCTLLEDDTAPLVAAKALGILAKGDPRALERVGLRLEHEEAAVREVAVEALGFVAGPGDARAVALLGARMEDEISRVRRAALIALPKVAERGDAAALALAYARLDDDTTDVRWAAVRALAELAAEGDAEAIQRLGGCLRGDASWLVRHAATEAIASVAVRDDAAVEALLNEHHESEEDAQVLDAIQEAIAKLGGKPPINRIASLPGGNYSPFAHNYSFPNQD